MTFRLFTAVCAVLLASPAMAAGDIEVDRDAPFLHQRTQVTFPADLFGLPRARMLDFGEGQYDVGANYIARGGNMMITVYLYRAGLPDAAVNLDMVTRTIVGREGFTPDQAASLAPLFFTPTGHPAADSALVTFAVKPGGEFRTGGVALVPHGQWLLKVRISSNDHTPDQLREVIANVVSALNMPAPAYYSGAVHTIISCTTPITFAEAHVVEAAPTAVIGAMLGLGGISTAQDEDGNTIALEVPTWCRDSTFSGLNLYRPNESTTGYILAIDDAGTVISVGGTGDLLSEVASQTAAAVAVARADANRTLLYALVDTLPDPRQLAPLLNGRTPLAATDRSGEIEIIAAAVAPAEAD